MDSLLNALRNRGWTVRSANAPHTLLGNGLSSRYSGLSEDVVSFLAGLDACHARDESAWFLTAHDYARDDDEGISWDECETMSLEAASEDPAAAQQVRRFWDRHFPFMLSVQSDYDYLAIALDTGAVVHGSGPDWEETSVVAVSFQLFLDAFDAAARSAAPVFPYSVFLGPAAH